MSLCSYFRAVVRSSFPQKENLVWSRQNLQELFSRNCSLRKNVYINDRKSFTVYHTQGLKWSEPYCCVKKKVISFWIVIVGYYRNRTCQDGPFWPCRTKGKSKLCVPFVNFCLIRFSLQMPVCRTHLRSIHLTFSSRVEVFVPTQ